MFTTLQINAPADRPRALSPGFRFCRLYRSVGRQREKENEEKKGEGEVAGRRERERKGGDREVEREEKLGKKS